MSVLAKTSYLRCDFIEGADREQLERAFARHVKELLAENAERQKTERPPLGIKDVAISSASDVFFVHFVVTDASDDDWWAPGSLGNIVGRFWMAHDAESLGDYQEAAIAAARGEHGLRAVRMGVAGLGLKRTVVGFIAGVTVNSEGHGEHNK